MFEKYFYVTDYWKLMYIPEKKNFAMQKIFTGSASWPLNFITSPQMGHDTWLKAIPQRVWSSCWIG